MLEFPAALVGHNSPMSASDSEIIYVSDTALMVAACRAAETEVWAGSVSDFAL
jgi:hypothetical protein